MIIYIAGIQNIPEDVIEAAKIDGATPFQILYKITIPLVMPSVTICLFLTLSNSFKLYDQNYALMVIQARLVFLQWTFIKHSTEQVHMLKVEGRQKLLYSSLL